MAIFSREIGYIITIVKDQVLNFRVVLFSIVICLFALSSSQPVFAQRLNTDSLNKARQHVLDSTREARQRVLDSTRTAVKARIDSAKLARQHISDSLTKVREHRADSMAAIRKYRESRRFRDSVANVRQRRVDSIQSVRTKHFDSIKIARQRVTDSTIAARKAITDAVKARQKKRSDSMAAIRKYRESKRFQDSVAIARKVRLDSIQTVRKAFNDSAALARKVIADSLTAMRKAKMDSATAVRTKYMDSVKGVRTAKADSLAKAKERRKKVQEQRAKEKEQKLQLAFELKLKKKREAWSNEKMLKKRWSLPRRALQNTFTHYNYYFNTDRKMDEALDNMQRARRENYDSTLGLFPYDPDRDSSLLSADMDSIIQKASVGIQIHDPRTKWGDDLYLLLGQAYYYKGDYENASTAFRYIVYLDEQNKKKKGGSSRPSKIPPRSATTKPGGPPSIAKADNNGALDFLKHQSVHNEALLWLARTYTEWHQEGNAESIIDLLETDPNLPQSLRGRLALEKAYVALSENDHKVATEQLAIVANDKTLPDWLRQRAAYLNGQLLQDRSDYAGAANSFDKVIDLHPKIDMDFYARKNKAYAMMMSGGDQEQAVSSLRSVLNDGKYAPYYEQVYYVMGKLAANTGKSEDALIYLRKGLDAPKATKKQKALSYAAMGDVYYNLREYVLSKNAYDSAVNLAGGSNDSALVVARIRSGALGDITGPVRTIKTQDSLLALASLSNKEQLSAVRKYIRQLEDAKRDSAFRAENKGLAAAAEQEATNMFPGSGGSYTNWYFSNAALMQQGYNEFKRKWPGRPLVDNWRRSAALSMAGTNSNNPSNNDVVTDEEGEAQFDENGLPTEESLLSFIPNDGERKDLALKRIRRGYVDLAAAYVKLLEDYPQAIGALDTLDKRFPAHEHKAESIYLRYLIALRQNRLSEAQLHATALQTRYGDTKWAKLVRPTEDGEGLPGSNTGVPVTTFYDDTYGMLLQRQYPEVLQRAKDGQRTYTDVRYQKKFRIIEAIASVGVNDFDRADTLVTDFINNNPTDSLRAWADAVLAYIKKNRPATPSAATNPPPLTKAPAAGSVPPTDAVAPTDMDALPVDPATAPGAVPAPNVTKVTPPANPPAEYMYKPQEEHYVLFTFKNMEQRAMGVKAAMTDFNTFKFGNLKLDSKTEIVSPDLGMVITRQFANAGQARIYLNSLRGTAQVFREYKNNEYELLMISANNYLKLVGDKKLDAYLSFYRKNYK